MFEGDIISFLTRALVLTLMLSLPPIIAAAVVGTLVSLLQALTQVQEQTLSFGFKLAAVGIVLFMTASWIGGELYRFALAIFTDFPQLTS